MLILTRRIGETLIIGDGDNKVEISVLAVRGNQVRIGIEAPKEISIHRQEVYDRIQEEKVNMASLNVCHIDNYLEDIRT